MKYSKIALACGLALSAMAVQAAGPTIPAGTVTLYLSGASAPDNFLNDTIKDMLDNEIAMRGSTNASSFRAFLGKAKAGIPGVTAGSDILLIKRSKGGSVWGVDPVARAQRIEVLDLNNCTAQTATAVDPYSWACGVKGTDPGVSGHALVTNAGLVPDFGVSDVEPAMFKQPYNTENGQPQLTNTELARLTSSPVNQIMMGIVATDAVAATTHLSRATYGGMLAGKIDVWDSVDGSSSDPVIVCRRVEGSGTQTSYNWFFTGFPCNNASSGSALTPPAKATDSFGYDGAHAGTALDPILIDPSAGLTIVENSTSGNVRDCLKAAQNKTVFNVLGANNKNYRVNFAALTNPGKAVGVLSIDSYLNTTFDTANNAAASLNGYTFRMLDGAGRYNPSTQAASVGATGIAPSKANLVDGKYDFVVELSMQRRNASVTNEQGDVVAIPSAVKTAFYTQLVKNLGSTKYTGNDGGSFTTTPNAFATLPTSASYDLKPAFVNKYQRSANTCSPLVRFPSL